jgi:hypothetical protein
MELSGKVFKVLPVESGEGKNGTWKKQMIVIETDGGKYPKKVAVTFWSDLAENAGFVEGRDISVEFDVESREYNGKWYTDVKAWRINNNAAPTNSNNNSSKPLVNETTPAHNMADVPNEQMDDDLPF